MHGYAYEELIDLPTTALIHPDSHHYFAEGHRTVKTGKQFHVRCMIKQTQLPTTQSPRVVGIEDWSWKRGLCYGTLICDLETNKQGVTVTEKTCACRPQQFFYLQGWTFQRPATSGPNLRLRELLKFGFYSCVTISKEKHS